MPPAVKVPWSLAVSCVFALGLTAACDAKEPAKAKDEGADTAEGAEKGDPPSEAGEAGEVQPTFAEPKAEPPPAPVGSLVLQDPWLYVQTCAESEPCPDLTQPAGEAHCRKLMLEGLGEWRLPKKDEVARFAGVEGLEATAGHHWTQTPFADAPKQVWIVDPEDAGVSTTIPRDRKPFRIRCVKEP